MKYSLRKSFSYRRRVELDDEHTSPRLDANGCSNSNLNLVKSKKKTKNFLQRRRRFSSSPPPPSPPPIVPEQSKSKSKLSEPRYSHHINIDDENDDDDDPFTSAKTANRVRPIDRLTYQLRKSFRGTLTRQRTRLESNNSNKRLLFNRNESNPPVTPSIVPSMSTGLSSQFIAPVEPVSNEANKIKAPAKRRKAPLAPSHMHPSYVEIFFSRCSHRTRTSAVLGCLFLIRRPRPWRSTIILNRVMFHPRMSRRKAPWWRRANSINHFAHEFLSFWRSVTRSGSKLTLLSTRNRKISLTMTQKNSTGKKSLSVSDSIR